MMFTLSEMKLLMIQLTADIKQTQFEVHQTKLDDPSHLRLENKLITLIAIKQKISAEIEQNNHQDKQAFSLPKTLIVDDSESTRDVIRCYFIELGFEQVDIAADGSQAWSRLQQGVEQSDPYELLVSDWHMPNMDGLQLLKSVRKDKTLHRLPTYLITGEREKELIMQAISELTLG